VDPAIRCATPTGIGSEFAGTTCRVTFAGARSYSSACPSASTK
jgi:hypothetical protein